MEKAAVLGAGSWGTALALTLADKGLEVVVYGNQPEVADDINQNHQNSLYLPDVDLPKSIVCTTDINELKDAELILLVVPSQVARLVLKDLASVGIANDALLISCSKGLDPEDGSLMSELLESIFPENPIAVLSGPSHAEEVAHRMATLATIGSPDQAIAARAQEVFFLPWFRSYTCEDVVGVEVGSVVKNVFAIAAGAADGLGLGDNAKAALVTRGLAEMTRLGVALGASEETFRGLSGIGDLIVTCYSPHSRNNRVGRLLGQGKTLQEAIDAMNQIAEGVPNAKNAYELARKLNVRTPIIDQTHAVLYEDKPCAEALKELLARDPRPEQD